MTASVSWELDREHEEFRASVRVFVDRQVRPVVEESEAAGRPPAARLDSGHPEAAASVALLRLASELVVDAVVEPAGLRAELIARLAEVAHWTRGPQRRHHHISPV